MRGLILLLLLALGSLQGLAQAGYRTEGRRVVEAGWDAKATPFRGRNGERFTFAFPGHGMPGSVWGTGLYTDDSSIATAAVHEGLLNPEFGGVVTIEIRPGSSSYRGSHRNGVRSGDFGAWQGSFVFVERH